MFLIIQKLDCSFIGCSNRTYKINKWKNETCTEHNVEDEGNCKKKGENHFLKKDLGREKKKSRRTLFRKPFQKNVS